MGLLSGVSVGEDGLITASFSNGETAALGKVAVATFVNMPGLRRGEQLLGSDRHVGRGQVRHRQ